MVYLTAATARSRLTNQNKYPDLSEAELGDLLLTLEDAVDAWLGWHAALTFYQETTQADRSGYVVLTNSPIDRISAVTIENPYSDGSQATQRLAVTYSRAGGRLKLPQGQITVQVTYAAGYDPIPRVFTNTMFQLLSTALETTGISGDLSFLSEPVKDVASLSLPGGLSKTFFKGGQSSTSEASKGMGAETRLDRLLAPLKQYRRHYVLTTGTCKRLEGVAVLPLLPQVDGGIY